MQVDFVAELMSGLHGGSTYLFIHLPEPESDYLHELPIPHAGFGSIKVDATIGRTTWRTSVFPSHGRYLLLVSKKLAAAESLEVGEPILVTLDIVI